MSLGKLRFLCWDKGLSIGKITFLRGETKQVSCAFLVTKPRNFFQASRIGQQTILGKFDWPACRLQPAVSHPCECEKKSEYTEKNLNLTTKIALLYRNLYQIQSQNFQSGYLNFNKFQAKNLKDSDKIWINGRSVWYWQPWNHLKSFFTLFLLSWPPICCCIFSN